MKLGYYLVLGNSKMKNLSKKVMIPAWQLEADDRPSWGPKIFHNLKEDDPVVEEVAVDVVLRSSAAPVYFKRLVLLNLQ